MDVNDLLCGCGTFFNKNRPLLTISMHVGAIRFVQKRKYDTPIMLHSFFLSDRVGT